MDPTLDDKLVVMLKDATTRIREVGKNPSTPEAGEKLSYALARVLSVIDILAPLQEEVEHRTYAPAKEPFYKKMLP